MKIKNEIPVILIFLICSISIFLGKGFLTPHTFYIAGDVAFPLNPAKFVKDYCYTWNDTGGLGRVNSLPSFLLIEGLIYLLWLIKIPLWIINRIWLIAPVSLLAYSTYYLYYSIFDDEEKKTGGILAGISSLFLPYFFYYFNPFLIYSLAGFSFLLGSLLRGLKYPEKYLTYAFGISLSICLLAYAPRTLYIALLCSFFYLIFYFLFLGAQLKKTIRFFFVSGLLCVLVNFLWILPIALSYLDSKCNTKNMLIDAYGNNGGILTSRINLLLGPNGSKGLHWVSRLIVDFESPASYFSIPIVSFFSFLVPFFAYLPLFLLKKRNIYPLICATIILTCFATTLRYPLLSQIYIYLFQYLPGFMMLNLLYYWISALGVFYAILLG